MQSKLALISAAWRIGLTTAIVVSVGIVPPGMRAFAQQAAQPAQAPQSKSFSKEQLEQLAAPIALYPDSLLSQVLMASTYPLEVVQAARWIGANSKLKGKALEEALQLQPWDASVKSLTAFPSVLKMMNDKLDWTQQLGDAFLAQQTDLLAAVQTLRLRADQSGNLKTTKEQKVTKSTSGSSTYIVIEPQSTSLLYVPAYNPALVYGTWPYPAYPPYAYYPAGYVAGSAFWFGAGVVTGAALWGGCNWARNEVNINVNRYNEFNRTNISSSNWQHHAEHRKGVPYSNQVVANQYRSTAINSASREQFRGRAEAGRQELKAPAKQQAARQAVQPRSQAQPRPASKTKQAAHAGGRQPSAFERSGSGAQVRRESARGQASRSASHLSHAPRHAPAARPAGRRGGGGRRR